jgi:hypothetical protein
LPLSLRRIQKKLPILAMFGGSLHSWSEAPNYPRCVINGVSGFFYGKGARPAILILR